MNTTTTYKFSDLPTQALKDQAIELHRDWHTGVGWWNEIYSDWKEKLGDLGFWDADIRFSGFCSQGDGASFTSEQVPLPSADPAVIEAWELLTRAAVLIGDPIPGDRHINDLAYGSVIRINHSYFHENSVTVDWEWNDPPFMDRRWEDDPPEALHRFIQALKEAVDAYFETVSTTVTDRCLEIYKDLGSEYEYLTSDELVAEALERHDMEFEVDEEGELIS